jgi:hypothetical protein
VALFCLFSPKIYIIIFHPDKNVRKLTMNSATYKKAPTTSTTCPTTSANHGIYADNSYNLTLQFLSFLHKSLRINRFIFQFLFSHFCSLSISTILLSSSLFIIFFSSFCHYLYLFSFILIVDCLLFILVFYNHLLC